MEAAELRPPWAAEAAAANHCLAVHTWEPAPERAPHLEYQTGMEVPTAVVHRDHNQQGQAAPEAGPEYAEPVTVQCQRPASQERCQAE